MRGKETPLPHPNPNFTSRIWVSPVPIPSLGFMGVETELLALGSNQVFGGSKYGEKFPV